jgi:hypothetical protein
LDGEASSVVAAYSTLAASVGQAKNGYMSLINHPGRFKKRLSGLIRLRSCVLKDGNGRHINHFVVGKYASITIEFEMKYPVKDVLFEIIIENHQGRRISYLSNDLVGQKFDNLKTEGEVQCNIPRLSLVPGKYSLSLMCRVGGDLVDCVYDAVKFDVVGDEFFLNLQLPTAEIGGGEFLIDHEWYILQ